MITSRITSKGQTTIPAEVRKALGLGPHDRIAYEVHKDIVLMRPLRGTLFEHKGTVRAGKSPEDFGKVRRKVRDSVGKRGAKR